MDVDIGNALAPGARPGIPRSHLEQLDERVGRAHDRIRRGMGADEHGYAALSLPDRTDPAALRETTGPLGDPAAVLTVGIGGSALGASTIVDACAPETDAVALDNVDPDWVDRTLEALPLEDTVVHVVSRSGTTAETLANFLVVRGAFEEAGVDWTERTVVTTGDSGPLAAMADRHDLPRCRVPDGVPGRYAALSPVGLVAPAICGVDIEAVLAGAADAAASLSGSLFDCPAYAYGATAYALEVRGAVTNAVVPYAEPLETFAEWFAQLWAESLGKGGVGQTPARALGVTDQHSQLQLYRAGRRDKLVSFVWPGAGSDVPVPAPDRDSLAFLADTSLSELLEAEFRATEASLAAAGRPSVRLEIDGIDEHSIGALLYGLEAACIMAGELHGLDAFDQPAVEWGKRRTRDRLSGTEEGPFEETTSLRVEQ